MGYFHTKNSNLVLFWSALEWKLLVYFTYGNLEYVVTAIWYTLYPFGNFVVIWRIFLRFVIISYQEKSGNPGLLRMKKKVSNYSRHFFVPDILQCEKSCWTLLVQSNWFRKNVFFNKDKQRPYLKNNTTKWDCNINNINNLQFNNTISLIFVPHTNNTTKYRHFK
jgi:hypothetical protein